MNLIVSGVPIEFPYEPYQCQVAYMEAVIKCLNNDGLNGALESPTGTGEFTSDLLQIFKNHLLEAKLSVFFVPVLVGFNG